MRSSTLFRDCLLLIATLLSASTNAQSWISLGNPLEGEDAGDAFGQSVSLNYAGDVLAIGGPSNSGGAQYAGHVRVFSWDGSSWTQLGADIDGETNQMNLGYDVAISGNGYALVIGATDAIDTAAGTVGNLRVYSWDGTISTWVQVGSDLFGEDPGEEMGRSVAINYSGTRVAGGAPYRPSNYSNGSVTIWEWDGWNYTKLGNTIMGADMYEIAGFDVSLDSLGNTVAIGSPSKEDSSGVKKGAAHVYTWNGSSWTIKGELLMGSNENDFFGRTVCLSADGNALAVGASDNNNDKGYVRIFDWNGSSWVQRGSDIEGENIGDNSGKGLSLSPDGNTVAIGSPENSDHGASAGHVRVFSWNGSSWVQLSDALEGSGTGDDFGKSVAVTNGALTLAAGGPRNSGSGYLAGHVKAYHYSGIGISEIEDHSILVYPNPSNGSVIIDFPNSIEESTISIYHLSGALVQKTHYKEGNSIEVQLPKTAGVYLLKIETKKGEAFIKRIIRK